jgi:ABC-type glutathione transport system ATPase component
VCSSDLLAFSVAIHANRDILLMDEVLAVGDSNFQGKCLTEFVKYKEQGKTVVLVTHDIATVQRYCDRAMLLREGKIEMIGEPEKVGNEYIRQNMSDEEKRIVEEEERKKIQEKSEKKIREKNKSIKITKVEFLDGNRKERNIFRLGKDILARVYFQKIKPVGKMNFGIAIHDQENRYIFGTNTVITGTDTEETAKREFFELRIKNSPLKKNSYFIKAGVFGENDRIVHDFLEKSKEFQIADESENQGMVELDCNWE